MKDCWVVYLLVCADNSYYIGITNNLDKRLAAHNAGRGAKYIRGRTPVSVIRVIEVASKSEALKLEYAWKQVSKDKKATFMETK
jgi:putative endonuclease